MYIYIYEHPEVDRTYNVVDKERAMVPSKLLFYLCVTMYVSAYVYTHAYMHRCI